MADSCESQSLRLALYSGLCVRHDAISNGLRLKLDAVEQWRAAGSATTAVAFVHSTDYDDDRIRVVDGVASLLRLEEFRAADVHVFEFGIYYGLFDAVFLVPDRAAIIGVYHNVTPPALADDPAVGGMLERSIVQRHNLSCADHVITHSDYSRDELLDLGFAPERVSVIPLPPSTDLRFRRPSQPKASGPTELLFVGRFVRSKGVLDLLDAVDSLRRVTGRAFRLTLAGNPAMSSPGVLDEVRRRCDTNLAGIVRLILAPDEATLASLYADSDIFVMPSYHEGYCVPAVEALTFGCKVVAYDSSNLPFVLGGLGTLVTTGDVGMLAARLADCIERVEAARASGGPMIVPTTRGEMEEGAWNEAVRDQLAQSSAAAFVERFESVVRSVTSRRAVRLLAGAF